MKTKTNLKAGPIYMGVHFNHNETLAGGLRVKTKLKAGPTAVERPVGLRVKTAVKAGCCAGQH